MKLSNMIRNPLRLALKMYILIWVFLILQILLKVTFNWWQPYAIPTEQLERLSNFIDSNRWLEIILHYITFMFNGVVIMLCSIHRWWFKNNKQLIITFVVQTAIYIISLFTIYSDILIIIATFTLPFLYINKGDFIKTLIYTIISFILSNVFLALSLWLEGFVNADEMTNVVFLFLANDYYIMLLIKYITINLIELKLRLKKENNK